MSAARKLAMTTTATAVASDVAQVRHRQIVELKATLGRNVFALGVALTEMRDRELYRALGYPTFDDYLVSREVGIQRSTAYSFMRIYHTFRPVQERAERMDWGKLDILAQIVKEGDEPEQTLGLLDEADGMTRTEVRAGVRAVKQQRLAAQPANVQHVGHKALPSAQPDPWPHDEDSRPESVGDEPPAATIHDAPIATVSLVAPVSLVPSPPAELVRMPVDDPDDDGDLTVRQCTIRTSYTHLIEDLLKVAHKHRETLAEIDRREIEPLMTEADRDREFSVLVICDWFGPSPRPMQLRRV